LAEHLVRPAHRYAAGVRLKPGGAAVLLVAPAGVLIGHVIAYAASGPGHAPGAAGHGYLSSLAAVAVPLAVAGLCLSALGKGAPGVSLRQLCALQCAAFVTQETLEHLVAGEPLVAVVGSVPVWLGLGAQAIVAFGATAAVGAVSVAGPRLLAWFGGRPSVVAPPVVQRFDTGGVARPRLRPNLPVTSRGPPAVAT
jgi:hypothetical protein